MSEEVKAKMSELQIVGVSSLGKFTDEEYLEHLAEIERLLKCRKESNENSICIR